MDEKSTSIICDACGLPASPEHIAARVERLELATRFRPIHIHVLFLALAPLPRLEDDFYRPPESRDFFDPFLSSLDILPDAEKPLAPSSSNGPEADGAKLLEFQRKGYYLTYLSECPLMAQHSAGSDRVGNLLGARDEENDPASRECISRLSPTLIRRIRYNYKPKHVALLGTNLSPLIEAFERAGLGPLLLLNHGAPLTVSGCAIYLEPAIKGPGATSGIP